MRNVQIKSLALCIAAAWHRLRWVVVAVFAASILLLNLVHGWQSRFNVDIAMGMMAMLIITSTRTTGR